MLDFLLPAHVKKGKRLLHAVTKFAHANSDVMKESEAAKLKEARESYAAVLKTRDKEKMREEEEKLLKVCEKSVPGHKNSAVRENVEVIIVAIVIALGIRAYFLQPFKIPTASMYPTLNGIVATRMDPKEFPNMAQRAWELAWGGTNWTELHAPEGRNVAIVSISQRSYLMFFTKTTLTFNVDGAAKTEWSWAPARHLLDPVEGLWNAEVSGPTDKIALSLGSLDSFDVSVSKFGSPSWPVKPGQLLASGFIKTGDQVLVDKMSYHFRMPTRGEVFVFSTLTIEGINMPAGVTSQHYIKRLAGVPGDKILLAGEKIYTNGKLGTEFGFQRVMSKENGYRGYSDAEQIVQSSRGQMLYPRELAWARVKSPEGVQGLEYSLQDKQYLALGDNSYHSSDSRVWGAVPEENIIGPAFVVYWPFAPHFGIIK